MRPEPIAFMSYVHLDDKHEEGRLTQFRERLSGEVRMQSGEEFPIFQDRAGIDWGEQWRKRIEEALDAAVFFIPIVTPAFFNSPECLRELDRFLDRERKLGRTDLILPVYYVECDNLSDKTRRESNRHAKEIAKHQYADWRELRFEPFTSSEVNKTLVSMGRHISEALKRNQPAGSEASTGRGTTAASAGSTASEIAAEATQVLKETAAATAEPRRGLTPKVEPPTLVVDALHRGDHATLSKALRAAPPGARLLVRPGLYREGLVIDKPVEIVGDGDPGEIIVEASGKDVVLFRANMGRIVNLTLRQTGGGNWYCVDIAQGRLDLEDCDITSGSLACVAVRDGADPRLRRNRIHDGKQDGVFVYDNGQGVLEDNDIFGNALSGVAIRTGGNPTLRRNRVHDGRESGVFVYDNGQGVLEDNEIFGNAYSGVTIKTGGNPTLRRNRITNNALAIHVYENGAGLIENNDLRGNRRGAWKIEPDCESGVSRSGNQET